MSAFDTLVVKTLPIMPKFLVWRVAKKYVAGETVDDAMKAVTRLQSWGAMATIDVLGEFITDIKEAEPTRDAYLATLDEIEKRKVNSNVSVKLTAFGLSIDEEACYRNVLAVVERAKKYGNFVRIDMEDSPVTTKTLNVYRRLRAAGYTNVGVVLQAYMRRTLDDIGSLADLCPSYRLCKGIYVEPPEIAYKDREEIRKNYMAALEKMLVGGSYVGIATHDRPLADDAERLVKRLGLSRDRYEFQMLLGVDETLGKKLIANGHRLRIYVPYGRDWHGYCVRRLKENPKIARYVVGAMFKS